MVKLLSRLRLSAGGPEFTTEEFNHLAAVSVEQFTYMGLFTDGEGECINTKCTLAAYCTTMHYVIFLLFVSCFPLLTAVWIS